MQQSLLFSTYEYDVNGERCCKKTGEETVRYFLDGNKILGENRTYKDGTSEKELRYLYDADGLVGCEYRNQDYLFVRDALNNITAITHRNKRIVARYKYDTWGNCTVYNEDGEIDTDPISIGNVNPFRWKSLYYDTESGLYYANGSYYDPTTGLYVDASSIESVIENGLSSNRLDRNSLMCNNVLELASNPYTINPATELHPDPTYDADENLPWWLVAMDWVRGILYDITKWFNELHWSIKLTAGIILLAGAIGFTVATGGGGAGVISVLVQTAIGVGVGVGLYTVGALMSDSFSVEGLADAALNAFLITSATVFISSAVNYIKYACRSKPVSTQVLKQDVKESVIGVSKTSPDKITGYTQHGLEQAIFRDGHGVSPKGILDAVKNPVEILYDVSRETYKYKGINSVTILNQQGKIVSTWATSSIFWRY